MLFLRRILRTLRSGTHIVLFLIGATFTYLMMSANIPAITDDSFDPEHIPPESERIVIAAKNEVYELAKPETKKHSDIISTSPPTEIQSWLQRRQNALNSEGPRKVLLFCYMRGGSTFMSELFRKNPDAMYWYEPLDGFYSGTYGLKRWSFPMHTFYSNVVYTNITKLADMITPVVRHFPDWEKALIANFHHNMVGCNLGDLPVDTIAHSGILAKSTKVYDYRACRQANHLDRTPCGPSSTRHGVKVCGETMLSADRKQCGQKLAIAKVQFNDSASALNHGMRITHDTPYTETELAEFIKFANCQEKLRNRLRQHCIPALNEKCMSFKLVAYKALRITMDSVKDILEKDPDTFVVYVTRDPRAIAVSSKKAGLASMYSRKYVELEAQYLCNKMKHDLELYKHYKQLYPGAIKMIRYEDFSRDPEKMSQDIYDDIGVPMHNDVTQWIKNSQNSTGGEGVFSTNRADWTVSINKWRESVTKTTAEKMVTFCKDVLTTLNYQLSYP